MATKLHNQSESGHEWTVVFAWIAEKQMDFQRMLIEASTLLGDIVLDCIAITGEVSSIYFGFLKCLNA
jgi:hypothetical protein